MPLRPVRPRVRWYSLPGGWLLLLLFLQSACATTSARGRPLALEACAAFTVEPGAVPTRPVVIHPAEFQTALSRLARDARLARPSPRQAARELLRLLPEPPEAPMVESWGEWTLEQYGGRSYTFLAERQTGPVALTPLAEHVLQEKYLHWCELRGGGDCLGLLDDGACLRTDDRRTLALALAFGSVLDEMHAALGRELNARALVSLVVWTVALYCMLWLVPEPTTKAVAATLGDQLQEAVTQAAKEWGPQRLSPNEQSAINRALEKGEYWLARLLEREARGRFVHARVEARLRGLFQFNRQGIDVVDPATGRQYEILSGTESNLARHGRRTAGEFFRMITF